MKKIGSLFSRITTSDIPLLSIDATMQILRVGVGMLIFLNHGIEKIFSFSHMLEIFPDPFGIGRLPSLIFALISDAVCSILVAIGLFTRISSLLICINLFVALFFVHNGNMMETHGELAAVYFVASLFIFLYGPGNCNAENLIKNLTSAPKS